MKNKFYNRKEFILIRIVFNNYSNQSYIYAAYKKLNIFKDDFVLVPVGNDEDIFSTIEVTESLKVVKVIDVTDDMSYLPDDYEIKHVIQKVNSTLYNKILKAKLG